MRKVILFLLLINLVSSAKSQINFDFSDSIVNQQKQFIIRFDVANGNIYLPVKKKAIPTNHKLSLFKKETIKLNKYISVPLYKDTVIDHKIVRLNYSFDTTLNPYYNSKKGKDGIRYLIAGKYYKPKVGSFIRLVFENVPKNMDIGVGVEFVDKNLENASTFEGFLNRYMVSVDTAISKDAVNFRKNIDQQINNVNSTNDSLKREIEDTLKNLKESIKDNISKVTVEAALLKNSVSVKDIKSKKSTDIDLRKTIDNLADAKKYLDSLPDTMQIDSSRKFIPSDFKAKFIEGPINEIFYKIQSIDTTDSKFINFIKQVYESKKNIDTLTKSMLASIDSLYKLHKKVSAQNDSLSKRLIVILDSISYRRTIYIQPIQIPNNDISLLKITYKTAGSPEKDVYREIMLKNKYGFKLDFSTGFLGTGLKDDYYRIIPSPNTIRDTATIIADEKGKFAIGFALLAHAYFRTGERVNFAINTGLMLNSSNQTINYLAGLSLPLGLEQRFIISGGIAFGKVKRLTSGFYANTPYPSSVLNLSSGVPYTEKWENSWYIGVSYNLSSLTNSAHKTVIAR